MNQPVHHSDPLYSVLRRLVDFGTRCHYNNVVIKGLENIPNDGSFIFAPCHQNAMMDPLAILLTHRRSVVFLCRADIFGNPIARRLLNFLKILPVYRIRDGKSNLKKNEEIFKQSQEALVAGTPLCLMAEGTHNNKHQLLPLVKGMFRIAGETQKFLGDQNLYILPVGIDYDDYQRPYSNLVLNIGRPFGVKPFMDTYCHEEPVALNQMRDKLTSGLKAQMFHIETKTHYQDVLSACDILNRYYRQKEGLNNSTWNRFLSRRSIESRLSSNLNLDEPDNRTREFFSAIDQYNDSCKQLHISPHYFAERWTTWQVCGTTLCILAFGLLCAIYPPCLHALLFCLACYPLLLLPTHIIPKRTIDDTQFRSSINFVIRFGFSILYVPIFSIIVGINHGILWGLASAIIPCFIARSNGGIYNLFYSLFQNMKITASAIVHKDIFLHLVKLEKELQTSFHELR